MMGSNSCQIKLQNQPIKARRPVPRVCLDFTPTYATFGTTANGVFPATLSLSNAGEIAAEMTRVKWVVLRILRTTPSPLMCGVLTLYSGGQISACRNRRPSLPPAPAARIAALLSKKWQTDLKACHYASLLGSHAVEHKRRIKTHQ